MDARAKTVREIVQSGNDQYLVPFFQRHYSWKRPEWKRLWEDLLALPKTDAGAQHFMGSLVCTPSDHVPGEVTPYQLIDGQQRLTTITILLAALRDVAKSNDLDLLHEEITEDYLVHKRKKGLDRYRLLPRIGDREVLCDMIDGVVKNEEQRNNMVKALGYFKKCIEDEVSDDGADKETFVRYVLSAIADRLSLVVITIDDENPYEIFESLNFKGLPLQQSDLIRNFLFMQIRREDQQEFNTEHWQSFEAMFGESGKKPIMPPTRFYRNYLMRNGEYLRREEVYPGFKRDMKQRNVTPAQAAGDLENFLNYQLQLIDPARCEDVELRGLLEQVDQLEITTAHSLVMRLMAWHEDGGLDRDGLLKCLQMVASFVLRRSICGESTRPYSKWFVAAIKELGDDPVSNLESFLLGKQWPDNAAMVKALLKFELYRRERKKAKLMLTELEMAAGHKEPVPTDKLTIEHVMPQTIPSGDAGKSWKQMLGEGWDRTHKKCLHTFGNLTITGYNPGLSNRPFVEKKQLLHDSHVELNKYFTDLDEWNADEIKRRGEKLGEQVCTLWPRPAGGEPYVPTELVTEEERKFYVDYWTEFAAALDQSYSGLSVHRIRPRNWARLATKRRGFWFFVVVDRSDGTLEVGIEKLGKHGDEYMEVLWNYVPDKECDEIEQELGTPVLWEEYDEAVCLQKDGYSPRDKSDWPKEHEWLVSALETFQRILEPHVVDLDLDDYEPEGEEGGDEENNADEEAEFEENTVK